MELETGHVQLISDELEYGDCRNMTPESIVRLCMEVQRKEEGGPVASLLRSQEDSFARTLRAHGQGFIFPSRQSPATPIPILKILQKYLHHLINGHYPLPWASVLPLDTPLSLLAPSGLPQSSN